MRIKAAGALALIAGAALLAAACGGGSGSDNTGLSAEVKGWATGLGGKDGTYAMPKVPQTNDTYVAITDKPYNTYNNGTTDGVNQYNGFALIPALLSPYILNGNNQPVLDKDLMDSVDVSGTKPQTITWRINPKATWSDGAPVSCKDFWLTWLANAAKVKDFRTGGTTGYEQMTSTKCDGDKAFQATFPQGYADYKSLFGVTANELVPAHILERQTGIADITKLNPTSSEATLKKAADFWNDGWKGFDPKLAVADGPYMISEYQANQSVTLVRNPKFTGNPGGPARIVLKAVQDPVAQAQALQNGDAQVVYSAQANVDGSEKLQQLNSQGVTYQAKSGLTFEHLDLNFRNPLFQDEAVRKAFFQCVDRNEIVQKLIKPVQGNARTAGSAFFFPGDNGWQDVYSDKSTGNPQQAIQTLEADGWKMVNGVMSKGSQRLSFSISHTDIPRRTQTVQLVQSECKKAGFDIADKTDPNFLNGPVSAGQYDVALFGWAQAPFKSSSITVYKTGGGQNYQKLSNPQVDAATDEALQQPTAEAAIPFYQKADAALASTYATLPLFNTPDVWAFQNMKYVFYQSYDGALWNVGEWQKSNS